MSFTGKYLKTSLSLPQSTWSKVSQLRMLRYALAHLLPVKAIGLLKQLRWTVTDNWGYSSGILPFAGTSRPCAGDAGTPSSASSGPMHSRCNQGFIHSWSWAPPGPHWNSRPHFVFAVFLEEGLYNFCRILRCPWFRKFQNCLVCCPNLQGPLSSCTVSSSPAQAGECKQPKKLASPFISRVFFFLTFVFIFESDAHYSKLLKGVRTFPPRRKWNWYAK